jgi:putative chitinase
MPRTPDPDSWVEALNAASDACEISTPRRTAAFLAQIAVESSELTRLAENLNYSAARLVRVWPNRFPDVASALPFALNPEKLANYVYAKRLGNGDEASGDGWLYRGRGVLQITGRGNYRAAGKAIGEPLEDEPDRMLQRSTAAFAAGQFWKSHGLNELADDHNDDEDDEDFVTISIKVNGGRQGLDQRRAYWAKARQILGIA